MYKLQNSVIKKWGSWVTYKVPLSINTICPHCAEKGTFSAQPAAYKDAVVTLTAICPTCDKNVYFVMVNHQQKNGEKEKNSELYIIPAPKIKEPIDGFDEIPDKLKSAYEETLKTYNHRLLSSTANNARRVLEGICKLTLNDHNTYKNLHEMLQVLPDKIAPKETLEKLCLAIKNHGNLGSHFNLDDNTKIEDEDAVLAIELLEYLLDYIYILPQRIQELKERVDKSNK